MNAICGDIVRTRDRDRYLAVLLAPSDLRRHLFALYAFDLELRAIPERISDSSAGRIRLGWWRDSLQAGMRGSLSGNPIADLLQSAVAERRLSYEKLEDSVQARYFDIEDSFFSSSEDFARYLDRTFGTVVECACSILARGRNVECAAAAKNAGRLSGLIWILSNLASHLSKGKLYIPVETLARYGLSPRPFLGKDEAGSLIAPIEEMTREAKRRLEALKEDLLTADHDFFPAFAHLAPARLYLKALCARANPLDLPRMPTPLRSQWRMWRFTRRLRL